MKSRDDVIRKGVDLMSPAEARAVVRMIGEVQKAQVHKGRRAAFFPVASKPVRRGRRGHTVRDAIASMLAPR